MCSIWKSLVAEALDMLCVVVVVCHGHWVSWEVSRDLRGISTVLIATREVVRGLLRAHLVAASFLSYSQSNHGGTEVVPRHYLHSNTTHD
ncbi:hypothetical protein BU24DRAFT_424749 [Aaosphaeria arxii CBS 175.79]|uniref:Secreted protein n=1 Tax=Aaosphaeria arxii CBS 175.79 TaxID=1450172 RepID=A0A6A5XKG0_9PLEO|nr:uncharacterized protein BU24DRAFT_424749 [Aaosphaeria arxii CBS 175.79]KAF2013745.1 hypothetical protein BU24DRAFT_424749 [Aaosphaeria arxii CBS 175.79]